MSDASAIASLISDLRNEDAANRIAAATAIFDRGSELARASTQRWLADGELAACFIFDGTGSVKRTVGVAVSPETFEQIRSVNGLPSLAAVPPDQDAREFELDFPGGVRLDILTTRQPDGPGAIARYLQKFGEGIQQVEIQVRDADHATELLRGRFALEPIYPITRAGADGTRVNFFLVPAGSAKVLIELVEAKVSFS